MATAAEASATAAPAIHSERPKFSARKPIACQPSNDRHTISATPIAATSQSTRCSGRGVHSTVRISP